MKERNERHEENLRAIYNNAKIKKKKMSGKTYKNQNKIILDISFLFFSAWKLLISIKQVKCRHKCERFPIKVIT